MRQFISQIPPEIQIIIGKAIGAFAGSMISLAYVLPKGKREAATRSLTSISAGLVFGLPVGIWISNTAGISDQLDYVEIAVMGAATASLCIWTALGIAVRLVNRNLSQAEKQDQDNSKENASNE